MKKPYKLGIFVLVVSLAACEARFIAEYDDYTDNAVSDLQNQVEKHLTKMEKLAVGFDGKPVHPDCDYSTNQNFYFDAIASTRSLKTRNEIRPDNDLTTRQLGLLIENLDSLELLHKGEPPGPEHCLSAGDVQIARMNMDQMFRAILKLEQAKKRGEN